MDTTKLPVFFCAAQPDYRLLNGFYPAPRGALPHLCCITDTQFFTSKSENMPNQIFFTILLYGAGTTTLSAQAASQAHSAQIEQAAVTGVVDSLTQTALYILLGAIVLAGAIYLCYVGKTCADLKQPRFAARRPFLHLLILTAGLSAFGSGCTSAQWARAADYHAAQESDIRSCSMNHHYDNRANETYNNRYPYRAASNWSGPSFCKQCGQRIFRNR